MTVPALQLRSLCRRFGGVEAISDVSFTVAEGEVLGFVGPNGSGKTTTLRIVAGFLDADAGRVEVGGYDVVRERHRAQEQIGYLPESVPLYRDMRVTEYLRFRARLKGLGRRRVRERVDAVLETCDLGDSADRVIGRLSKGFRQRVGLADALVAEPPILILDEPTSGLDPLQVREFRSFIADLSAHHTVVLSSHILTEIENLATRVVVLSGGRVVADGALDELRAGCGLEPDRSLEEVFLALVSPPPA